MSTIEIDTDGQVVGGPDAPVEVDPGMIADIRKFERCLAGYLAGEIDEDVFKVFRLANGVYGQRQGGTTRWSASRRRTAPSPPTSSR